MFIVVTSTEDRRVAIPVAEITSVYETKDGCKVILRPTGSYPVWVESKTNFIDLIVMLRELTEKVVL